MSSSLCDTTSRSLEQCYNTRLCNARARRCSSHADVSLAIDLSTTEAVRILSLSPGYRSRLLVLELNIALVSAIDPRRASPSPVGLLMCSWFERELPQSSGVYLHQLGLGLVARTSAVSLASPEPRERHEARMAGPGPMVSQDGNTTVVTPRSVLL